PPPAPSRALCSSSATPTSWTRSSGPTSRRACVPACRRTSFPTRSRSASAAEPYGGPMAHSVVGRRPTLQIDGDALVARLEPRHDAHVALGHAVVRGQKFDKGFVRLAVDRPRREPDLDALAVPPGKLRARRARLHVQLQHHAAGGPLAHHNARSHP